MNATSDKSLVYLISDGSMTNTDFVIASERFLELLVTAVSSHIQLVQIREKQLSARNLFQLATRAKALCEGSKTYVLINDRVDIAVAAKADGVHLTSQSIRPEVVREFVPNNFLIGVSTHSRAELELARDGRADFAVFGPVYASPGKAPALGVEALNSAVSAAAPVPVLGLGGVDSSNYREILTTGAAGFAAIRFLNDAKNHKMLKHELNL